MAGLPPASSPLQPPPHRPLCRPPGWLLGPGRGLRHLPGLVRADGTTDHYHYGDGKWQNNTCTCLRKTENNVPFADLEETFFEGDVFQTNLLSSRRWCNNLLLHQVIFLLTNS